MTWALLLAATVVAAQPQTGEGVPDSIRHYETVAMMSSAASDQVGGVAGATMDLSLATLGREFDLKLEMFDLFAPGAMVHWVDDSGVVKEPAGDGVYLRGRVEGETDSWVRLTLRGDALAGVIASGDEMYFLEPAARFFGAAAASETLAYRLSDVDTSTLEVSCGTQDVAPNFTRGKTPRLALREMLASVGTVAGAAGLKRAEIGLVADFDYFNKSIHGAESAADMAEVLNNVDGIYQSELGVTVQAGGTVVFTTASDPFDSTTMSSQLQQFAGWRDNNNDNSSEPMWNTDLAHLFTGRNLSGSVIGIAYIGALCRSDVGVGVDEDYTTNGSLLTMLLAHEMGHNFGAPHDNQTNPPSDCGGEPGTYIMNPSLSTSLQQRFSTCSKIEIAPHVNNAGCFDDVVPGTPTETFTPLPTSTITRTPTATRTPTPPALAAAFVSQSVPSSMTAGQQYAVSVTMRNMGSATWSEASLFRLGAINPHNNSTWGMGRLVLASGETVEPGEQKTFSWTVTAPLSPATYNFQWQMLQEGVAWFGQTSSNVAVNVAGAGAPNAAFISQTVPSSMVAGQQYSVSVTMQNTGATTWTAAALYRLGSASNGTWGAGRVVLGSGDSIAPGQQKTFTWTAKAPANPGTYNFQWRMLQEGVTWFGPFTPNLAITVTAGSPPNAAFVAQDVPTTMNAGQNYTASVTMRNTGGTTWTAAALHRLGAINPYDNITWGLGRVMLSGSEVVSPQQEKTFTFTAKAPTTPGTYNFQWRMLQEGVTWFGGNSANVVIVVD